MDNQAASSLGWHATSTSGVVAAGGAEAVAAGISILEAGGNAADAAVATIFALNVTDHGACSIGGEVPLLIYDAQHAEVKVLAGQGRAPQTQDAVDWYMANGIPGDGDIKMAPVPAVVDLCITTLQRYGTITLAQALQPTLCLLDVGEEEWQPKLAATLRCLLEEEELTSGDREVRLQAAADRFYGRHESRNDIAEQLEADYIAKGGFLRRGDLAAHHTAIEEPVTFDYRGYCICKCGPWTQGPVLGQALRLLEAYDLKAMGAHTADYAHVVVEALKLALADRDAHYGDPAFVDVPLEALLSRAYADLRRPLIDMKQASLEARPGDPSGMNALGAGVFRPDVGGTTTCVVADRWGNVVSATPSANVPKEASDGGTTGVTFGNRLRSLNTAPGHPNCIQAGKRPRITLTPTLVLKDRKPVMAISVAGGDLQEQTTLSLLLHAIEFGMLPEAAVTAPRLATVHHQDSFDPNPSREQTFKKAGSLRLDQGYKPETEHVLAARGHVVKMTEHALGRPVMLWIDHDEGLFYAAGDPRTERHAAGL